MSNNHNWCTIQIKINNDLQQEKLNQLQKSDKRKLESANYEQAHLK